ncbi:protein asteroid-like [Achroia grisella]|uniref:protein asteroid-like n=1 Tax=Achroia grisella TaxID=688607 RepID=UPI0027D2C6EA|nr:protein asteroid-like [Achroia grisella]
MGVRGLTTYVNLNQDLFLEHFLLHDSCVVIDGNSMCAQLYRCLNSFSAFGGDYDKYASYVKKFFKTFRKCNIVPYVIFDGGHETRKLKTAYCRVKSKISGASRLDPVTQGYLQIFPLLFRNVFRQVLTEMQVPFTVCEFEADDEIAVMARHLNCPVLSYDSDFFIYNVSYIPFNTLDHKPTCIEDGESRFYALECKVYRVEFLTKNFGGLQEDMLPLLATLLGNDYVEKRVFKKFFSEFKLPKSKRCKNNQQRSIHGVFKWLQNETLESAISKILGRCKKKQKDRVYAIIKKSIYGYNSKKCRSLKYFNFSSVDDVPEESNWELPAIVDASTEDTDSDSEQCSNSSSNSDISDDENSQDSENDEQLPSWYISKVRNNLIPPEYLNLYTHHLHFCSPQAEDYTDQDAFLCTLPILRYSFDILTDFTHDHCMYVSRENCCNFKRMLIDKEYAIPRLLDVPFNELSNDQLNSCFSHFLTQKMPSLDLTDLHLLPPDFQLFMLSILWWVRYCTVPLANVHSLFICYIMLDIIDEKTGSLRGQKHFMDKHSKKIEEIKRNPVHINTDDDELFLNKNKVQYEDSLVAASVLIKHFEIDNTIRKKPKSYDVKRIHSFAQFQCCLYQLNCLNILCGSPFQTTKYKCYNGTFVYNIALKLENVIDPIKFFEQYLKGATTVLMYYKSMCSIYQKSLEKMCIMNSEWTGKKRRRRKKKKDEVDDIINRFFVEGFESQVSI